MNATHASPDPTRVQSITPQTQPLEVAPMYVNIETAVRLLGNSVGIHFIYKELQAGRLKGYQPGGKKGRWLIKVTDLEAWVEQNADAGPANDDARGAGRAAG